MSEFRVFLRGPVNVRTVLASLEAVRPFDVLDGPVGPHAVVGLRDRVLVEILDRRGHGAWFGPVLSRYRMFARFVDVSDAEPGRAWVAAHSLLWRAALCCDVGEALLVGQDTRSLRYFNGRIRAVPEPQQA